MTISLEAVLSMVAALGLGGVFGAYFQYRFQFQKDLRNASYDMKSKRYGAIIIQMLTVLQFEKHGTRFVRDHRPDLKSREDFLDELRSELLNSIVFAKDDVIVALSEFIRRQDRQSYIECVSRIRKDLWGGRTKLSPSSWESTAS